MFILDAVVGGGSCFTRSNAASPPFHELMLASPSEDILHAPWQAHKGSSLRKIFHAVSMV
jgi:hypothetical protein